MKEIWVCAKIPEFKHSNSVADSYLYWFWSDCCIFKNIDDVRIAAVFSGYWFGLVCDIFFANIDKVRILLVFLSNIYGVRVAVIFCEYWCCSECGSFFANIFGFPVFLWILMGFGLRFFFANILIGFWLQKFFFANIEGVRIAVFFVIV